jgi:thiol-disulfide isomerase/thioredoxin
MVDEHLAKLDPDDAWRPDVEQGLARMRTPGQSGGRKWLWAGAAVLASCAGLMAFPSPRAIAQKCVDACEGLFVNDAPVQLAKLGVAPDFALKDASGRIVRLADYKNKVVLLNFWATWCAPCRAEMPWFEEFEQTYKDRGFAMIGVAMDDVWPEEKSLPSLFKTVNYPLPIGNEDIAKMYGVTALPMTLLIDCDGRIKASHTGIVDKRTYEKEIVQLLGTRKGGSQ